MTTRWVSEPEQGGVRFAFGENWRRFSARIDPVRIAEAERSLESMLGGRLDGLTFLDVGCGSGLFSLAAARLGAAAVHSFDFDPVSVDCAQRLRHESGGGAAWTIERGSAVDQAYMDGVGRFDVVYAWGVLHHTGAMFEAMDLAGRTVAPGGRLFVSIYNDQGRRSRRWRRLKYTYNRLPAMLRIPYTCVVIAPYEARAAFKLTVMRGPRAYVQLWTAYKRNRGMSRWNDIVDWVGGYPFEVAKPETVFDFYRTRGFVLSRLVTCGGDAGCNQFVFECAVSESADG